MNQPRVIAISLLLMFTAAGPAAAEPMASPLSTAEGVVRELYRLVCVEPGQSTNWEHGFSETIVRLDATVFRDIANVLVLYDAAITDSERAPTRGVDSIDLIQKDGRWWIASIVNDLPNADHPIPARLSE
jgi:hypothetical protein